MVSYNFVYAPCVDAATQKSAFGFILYVARGGSFSPYIVEGQALEQENNSIEV